MFDAIILAGGLGTRLAPVLPHLPKALAPIQGIAFLDLMLEKLAREGLVSRAILALGFRTEAILHHYEEKKTPLPLTFSIESSPLGTGGALLHALAYSSSNTLLVLNGDCFCDLGIKQFYSYHRAKKADLTLAVLRSKDLSRYGSVCFDSGGRITEFQEKSKEQKPGYLSIGIYLIERRSLDSFPQGTCSIEIDLFPKLLRANTYAFEHHGEFLDIGTPASYQQAQRLDLAKF